MMKPEPGNPRNLYAQPAYGRIWVGCKHGDVPDTNMRLMCRDCFEAALLAAREEKP